MAQHRWITETICVLNHTVSGASWHNLWFNDTPVGETGINPALCGTLGCPVALVTGDDVVCAEAQELLGGDVTTVAVKRGSAGSAPGTSRLRRPASSSRRVPATLSPAWTPSGRPYDPGRPCEIRVEYTKSDEVERFYRRAGIDVVDGRTIVSRADDWWTAWRRLYF